MLINILWSHRRRVIMQTNQNNNIKTMGSRHGHVCARPYRSFSVILHKIHPIAIRDTRCFHVKHLVYFNCLSIPHNLWKCDAQALQERLFSIYFRRNIRKWIMSSWLFLNNKNSKGASVRKLMPCCCRFFKWIIAQRWKWTCMVCAGHAHYFQLLSQRFKIKKRRRRYLWPKVMCFNHATWKLLNSGERI